MPVKAPPLIHQSSPSHNASRLARAALTDLITPYGVQASGWELYKNAIFGRDSEAIAQDVDGIIPDIFETVMSSLVKYLGSKTDVRSGEEPGGVLHELRFEGIGGPRQREIYQTLSSKNGFARDGVYLDYGTIDAPPKLIRMVAGHVRRYGMDVLDQTFPHQDGEYTVGKAIALIADWVSVRIAHSNLGLLERLPDIGLKGNTQTLRDGAVSYLHEDGTLADLSQPVASIEVQGLAYDALLLAASLTGTEEEKTRWRSQAEQLRLQTFESFWMPDRNNWAMAVDRDHDGKPRQLKTLTTLPAELLETGIFENLPDGFDQRSMIEPLVRTVFSPDILTSVGPRMRSLRYANLLSYADYQGSWAVWPVSTNIISKGLHRYGFHSLERELNLRTLAGTVGAAGSFPEFTLVNTKGEVCWPLTKKISADQMTDTLLTTNFPELNQGWTVSAVLRILEEPCLQEDTGGWRAKLSEEVRRQILPHSDTVRLRPYHLDLVGGAMMEQKFLKTTSGHRRSYRQATHAIL